jgi:penicillin amidase
MATRSLLIIAAVAGSFLGALRLAQGPSADGLARASLAPIDGTFKVAGLTEDVQVVRDTWGVPHIYAKSTEDLFFAQGYVMAQDRLWQMEMWRRTSEGRLSEVFGPTMLPRDRQARLLKYRGPMDDSEWTSYHPQGRRIMSAYINGVNAFIASSGDRLPVEFVVTGIKPQPWTIETLVLRATTMADAASELQLARSVAQLGAQEANRRRNPDPWDPLEVPKGLDVSIVSDAAVAATRAGRQLPVFPVLPPYQQLSWAAGNDRATEIREPGSNNWVVSGAMSATGKPVVANDPHREVTLPSLRYIVHLNAPGWNVVGASEPPFVGVALGHNERVAWGLTIVGTDQQDVFVEEMNPADANQMKWNGAWEPLRIVREEIPVKGATAESFEMKFSRHGPIFYVDAEHHRAYVVRSALAEPGTAPYLAGLRLAQAANCREFLDAAMYWKAPTENLICGDVDGNISWQASALTPNRRGWVGRLPVPGTGEFDWQGFRTDLPRELNPARGFIATANHNIQPPGYVPPLMFKNADTQFDRITRLRQLIQPGRQYSLDDHQRMQHDAYSLRAAADLSKFRGWTSADPEVERARAALASWDAVYRRDSPEAALYETWRAASDAAGRGRAGAPEPPIEERLRSAVRSLTTAQGTDRTEWRWGRMHRRSFLHPVLRAFDLPMVERSGGAGTVEADGATYREILDVSDWDRSLGINVPGQSGQPGSPYYSNLLEDWAANRYFPLVYSKKAVEANAAHRLTLVPVGAGQQTPAQTNAAPQGDPVGRPAPQSQGRVRPPASIECPRDHLTAYTGRVVAWSRTTGRSTIRVHTDWDTDESATLRHAGTDDPSRWFLLRGESFKADDWGRIESAKGRLRPGTRATIWACDDGRPVIIDWLPPSESAK